MAKLKYFLVAVLASACSFGIAATTGWASKDARATEITAKLGDVVTLGTTRVKCVSLEASPTVKGFGTRVYCTHAGHRFFGFYQLKGAPVFNGAQFWPLVGDVVQFSSVDSTCTVSGARNNPVMLGGDGSPIVSCGGDSRGIAITRHHYYVGCAPPKVDLFRCYKASRVP